MTRLRERRSSKARIRSATVSGASPKFTPSAEGWEQIEQANGRKLNEQERAEIREILDEFFDWRRFEKTAAFVDEVNPKIEKVEQAVRALNAVLPTLFDSSNPDRETCLQAELAIERAWRGAEILGPRRLDAFYMLACGLVHACARARKEFEDNGEAWDGQAWDKMICELAEFAVGHGLSIAVRKDTDKQASVKHSPFVVFVEGIQEQFPPEVPIRFSTRNGLATQISRVLHSARENGIDFGREAEKQIPHSD